MATSGKVIGRYAKALFAALKGQATASKTLDELDAFARIAGSHEELQELIHSPSFTLEQKTDVVKALAQKMKLSPAPEKILVGLVEMGRLEALAPLVTRVRQMWLATQGVQPLDVYTAETLTADQMKNVAAKFEKILGGKVQPSFHPSQNLVGGLKVVAAGRSWDGTVSGWLGGLQEVLVEGER